MPAGAKQEGTSDVAYSRNQPSVLEDDPEPQRQSGARSGAQQTSNPKRIADSEDPRHATPGNWHLLRSVTRKADLATHFRSPGSLYHSRLVISDSGRGQRCLATSLHRSICKGCFETAAALKVQAEI